MKKFLSILAAMMIAMLAIVPMGALAEECEYGGDAESAGYGSSFECYLPANPSTGYEWTVNVTVGAENIDVVTEYYAAETETPMVGVPGEQWIRLDGVSEGQFEAEFVYARAGAEGYGVRYILNGQVAEDLGVIIWQMRVENGDQ